MSDRQKPPRKEMTVSKFIAYASIIALGASVIYGWVDQLPAETQVLRAFIACGIPTTAILTGIAYLNFNKAGRKIRKDNNKEYRREESNMHQINIVIQERDRIFKAMQNTISRLEQIERERSVVIKIRGGIPEEANRVLNEGRVVREQAEAAGLRLQLSDLELELSTLRQVGYEKLFLRSEWPAPLRKKLDRYT